jgi:site-specific recombinase XerD
VGAKSAAQRDAERHRLQRDCPERDARPNRFLLRDVVGQYLQKSRVTKRSYKDDARYGAMWIERFGGCELDEITAERLEKVQAERAGEVSAATVNREFAFLKHVFNVAVRNDRLQRNPFDKIRLLREPSGRVRYLSDEEEARLREAFATEEDRERLSFLLHTNLRKADFLTLRWRDVDLKTCILTIPRTKNGDVRRVELNSEAKAIFLAGPVPSTGPPWSSRTARGAWISDGSRRPSRRR